MKNSTLEKFNSNQNIEETKLIEDFEVDFRYIYKHFQRRKKRIILITSFGTLLSLIYSFIIPKTWQGFFEIIVSSQEETVTLPNLNFIKTNSSSSSLNTEIEILKSPSVLLPVFNYVDDLKNNENRILENKEPNIKSPNLIRMDFNNWAKNNLKVKLQPDTKVLRITYNDTDRNVIIPALELMTKTYQEYSGKNKEKQLDKEILFSKKQIDIYEKKSKDAFIKLEQFADKYDLKPITGSLNEGNIQFTDLELLKNQFGNRVREIDELLLKLASKNINYNLLIKLEKENDQQSLLLVLIRDIEKKLNQNSFIYKDNHDFMKELTAKKDSLILKLKKNVVESLNGEKEMIFSKITALDRPQEIISNYKLMAMNTAQEFKTLQNLEGKYRLLQLDRARQKDPWNLIAEPYLLKYPIAPFKSRVVLIGGFLSLFLTSFFSYFVERNTKIIFNTDEIEKFLKEKKLLQISKEDLKTSLNNLKILSDGYLEKYKDRNINVIPVGINDEDWINEVFNNISNEFKKAKLINLNNFINANRSINIFMFKLGETTKDDLTALKKIIDLSFESEILWIEI